MHKSCSSSSVSCLIPGGDLFYCQSPFPWSSVQWRSWKTENIQLDNEAGQKLNIRKAVGPQAASSLLQLRGVILILYFKSYLYFNVTSQTNKSARNSLKIFLLIIFRVCFYCRLCLCHCSFLLLFLSSGQGRTDSPGLVRRPGESLSQGGLGEIERFEGHWHVERQHLGLQRWSSRQAADCTDVECTLRMLAGIHFHCCRNVHHPGFVAKSTNPFVAVTGCDFPPSSGMHACTSECIVAFIAVAFECSYVSDIPLGSLKGIRWKRHSELIDGYWACWNLCTFSVTFINKNIFWYTCQWLK